MKASTRRAYCCCVASSGAAAAEDLAALATQVRATEIAFAKTLADRDVKAFRTMIASDVIWLADQPLRGPDQVLTRWQKFFDAAQPPFSWAPELVEVQEGGKLALSTGPGAQRRRETYRHLHLDLAPRTLGRVEDHLRSRLPGLREPGQMISRRSAIKGGVALTLAAGAWRSTSAQESGALRLWYRQPAEQWTEALPVGNGRLGAMIFGGVARERLQLNEDTLYAGGPYDPADPERAHRSAARARADCPGQIRRGAGAGQRKDDGAAAAHAVLPDRGRSAADVRRLGICRGLPARARPGHRRGRRRIPSGRRDAIAAKLSPRRWTRSSSCGSARIARPRSTCAPASKLPCPAACGWKATR